MNPNAGLNVRWPVIVVAAALLLATGGAVTYVVLRQSGAPDARSARASAPSTPASANAPSVPLSGTVLPDLVVVLNPDAVARAGITVATIGNSSATTGLRLPGLVEPNAYRQVVVTPLVAGRITRVVAELGQRVQRGQMMAQVFSPELADAHTRYTSARAELDVHERELARTAKLVEIGAASRQELERLHAEHAARIADVEGARSRLELLGVPSSALDPAAGHALHANADVPAPIDGVVTERLANVGLNVDSTTRLFTVVDLASVWVVAELYEKDFSRVHVGSLATVTTNAYPGLASQGRVSYIDPQVSSLTRTAKVRVEVPNPGNRLRFGMYADVQVSGVEGTASLVIPRTAVQTIGDRQVIYLVDQKQPGRFTEREVRLGPAAGEFIEVLSGVRPGDSIVAEGSFFVRAERERLGLRPNVANVQTAKVSVGEQGFDPTTVTLRAGIPARITFVRTTDKTCGTEVAFPSLSVKLSLPLNEPVVIEFTPAKTGEIAFACGMNMLHGTVVVQ